MVPRRPPRPLLLNCPRRVEGAGLTRCALTADTLSALASDPHTVGADSAGLAWSAICCTVWHGSITGRGAHCCTLIYPIIIGGCAELHSVRHSGCIWYVLEVLRRCDTLQRGAGGIIAACVGLVSATVEWGKLQEKRL